jgi:hypothetical protein
MIFDNGMVLRELIVVLNFGDEVEAFNEKE